MRRGTIRLALPAAAVAAALVLSGCNEEEDASSSESTPSEEAGQGDGEAGGEEADGDGGAESSESQGPKPEDLSEIDPASLPEGVSPDDLVDLIPDDLANLIPWDQLEDLVGGGEEERRPAPVDELQGSWYAGPEDEDPYLNFEDDEVMFIEDMLAEGDICYGSVVSEGSMELPYCTLFGETEWEPRTATLEFEGSALIVTWEDGTVHEYFSDDVTM